MNNDHGFRQRMLLRTDEELLDIVQGDRKKYQPEALRDAEVILAERGVAFSRSAESEVTAPLHVDYSYWPAIVGVLMVMAAIFTFTIDAQEGTATTVNIFLTVFFRIIVIVWIGDLTTRYSLNKTRWIILGILFGGWSLIAINIAIAMHQSPDDTQATLFGVPPEEEQDSPSTPS
jgi:hypothetical protein